MSLRTVYVGATIFDGFKRHGGAALVVEGDTVVSVCPEADLAEDAAMVRLGGDLLAPGYVDLQVNGGGGVMLNDAPSVEAIQTICDAHARCGTTSVLPTLITDTPEITIAAMNAAREAISRGVSGMAGLHLEGPHLSLERKGAHAAGLIRPMSDEDCNALVALARELPSLLLTVAPESVTGEQIGRLASAGAVVSLGHTGCTHAEATAAVDAGARCATHLFNAMSQLGSREPGLVGTVLADPRMSAGLIADGVHVDPRTIAIALSAKSAPGCIFLVSDAMAATGTALSEFQLNGRRILRRGGQLKLEDGTLAGSDLNLAQSVTNMIDLVGIESDTALAMASSLPAQLLGRDGELGVLKPGSQADFIWMAEGCSVAQVWRQGVAVPQSSQS